MAATPASASAASTIATLTDGFSDWGFDLTSNYPWVYSQVQEGVYI